MATKIIMIILLLLMVLFMPIIPHDKEVVVGVTIIEYDTVYNYFQQRQARK